MVNTHNRSLVLAATLLAAPAATQADPRASVHPAETRFAPADSLSDVDTMLRIGFRPTDIEVVAHSPLRFAVSYVRNRPPYYRSGVQIVEGTREQVQRATAGKRILDIETYSSGTRRYVALVAKRSHLFDRAIWHEGRWADVTKLVRGVVVDIESYSGFRDRIYVALEVPQTITRIRAWTSAFGATMAQIRTHARQIGMRIYEVERNESSFDAILVRDPEGNLPVVYEAALSEFWVRQRLAQGLRAIDLEPFDLASRRFYHVVFLPNRGWLREFGVGCNSSIGRVSQKVGGRPRPGGSLQFTVSGAARNGIVLLLLGDSKTRWGATQLPLDLAPFGAAGCFLQVAPHTQVAFVADASGAGRFALRLRAFPDWIGVQLFSQLVAVDPAANGLGLASSNGAEIMIGS